MGQWDEHTGQMHAGLLHRTGRLAARMRGEQVMADRQTSDMEIDRYTQAAGQYALSIPVLVEVLRSRPRLGHTSPSSKAYWQIRDAEVDAGIAAAERLTAMIVVPGRKVHPAELHELGNAFQLLGQLIERNHPEAGKDAELHSLVVEAYDLVKKTRNSLYVDGYADRSFRDYVDPRKAVRK